MNKQNKPWWQRKALWAGIIAVLAAALSLAGITLDESEQDRLAESVSEIAEIVGSQADE